GDRLDEVVQLGRIGQRAGGQHLPDQSGHEHLLTDDPVEVAARQAVPLADECQRVAPGDDLATRWGVRVRLDVLLRLLQADLDAPDRLGDVVEDQQIQRRVVVDGAPGELLHRLQQYPVACLVGTTFQLLARLHPGGQQPLPLDVPAARVRRVDLVLAVSGNVDVGIPRDRHGYRAAGVAGHVQQDDRVGVDFTLVGVHPQHLALLGRQRPAARVRPAVHADQQDVHRAVQWTLPAG